MAVLSYNDKIQLTAEPEGTCEVCGAPAYLFADVNEDENGERKQYDVCTNPECWCYMQPCPDYGYIPSENPEEDSLEVGDLAEYTGIEGVSLDEDEEEETFDDCVGAYFGEVNKNPMDDPTNPVVTTVDNNEITVCVNDAVMYDGVDYVFTEEGWQVMETAEPIPEEEITLSETDAQILAGEIIGADEGEEMGPVKVDFSDLVYNMRFIGLTDDNLIAVPTTNPITLTNGEVHTAVNGEYVYQHVTVKLTDDTISKFYRKYVFNGTEWQPMETITDTDIQINETTGEILSIN